MTDNIKTPEHPTKLCTDLTRAWFCNPVRRERDVCSAQPSILGFYTDGRRYSVAADGVRCGLHRSSYADDWVYARCALRFWKASGTPPPPVTTCSGVDPATDGQDGCVSPPYKATATTFLWCQRQLLCAKAVETRRRPARWCWRGGSTSSNQGTRRHWRGEYSAKLATPWRLRTEGTRLLPAAEKQHPTYAILLPLCFTALVAPLLCSILESGQRPGSPVMQRRSVPDINRL